MYGVPPLPNGGSVNGLQFLALSNGGVAYGKVLLVLSIEWGTVPPLHCITPHSPCILSMSPISPYTVPSFSNFSVSALSPTGSVTASWIVVNAGLRPITHLTVQWVEVSVVRDEDDLYDPTSHAYPLANIAIMEYDARNQSQVVMQDDIITMSLRGLAEDEAYFVGVTGTNVFGSKTTVFQFTARKNTTTQCHVRTFSGVEDIQAQFYMYILSFCLIRCLGRDYLFFFPI